MSPMNERIGRGIIEDCKRKKKDIAKAIAKSESLAV